MPEDTATPIIAKASVEIADPSGDESTAPQRGSLVDTNPRTIATVVLEVLAGARTPSEAAAILEISVTRYYSLESQAVSGLVEACKPKSPGKNIDIERLLAELRKENAQLKRDVVRHQSLLRTAQRAAGVKAALVDPEKKAKAAKKQGRRKPRKPTVRALGQAKRLQLDEAAAS